MTASSSKPLLGMRILITRPREQSAETAKKIAELGGEPIDLPTIKVAQPSNYSKVDEAISSLNGYDWLVFTSANGVRHFLNRALEKGIAPESIRCRVAAIGPATASAVESYGLKVSFVPSAYLTERLAHELPQVDGRKILLVRAEGADAKVSSMLKLRGAAVDEIYAYRVLANEPEMSFEGFNAILFTSPSTVLSFKKIFREDPQEIDHSVIICCIGPVTARTAQDLGFRVDVVSPEHTTEGLLRALVEKVNSK